MFTESEQSEHGWWVKSPCATWRQTLPIRFELRKTDKQTRLTSPRTFPHHPHVA